MAGAAPYPSTGKRRESGLGIVRERYNVNKMTDQDINDKVMLQRWTLEKTIHEIFLDIESSRSGGRAPTEREVGRDGAPAHSR
jgi:hypothetical protein